MAPGSILQHISFPSTCQFLSPFPYFAIFYFPFHKPKIPKILLYCLSISIRSHVANNHEGIDNPFITLGASWCLFVQVFGGLHVVSYWIDTLVIKTEANAYSTLLHHPFLFKGKTNASSRGSSPENWSFGFSSSPSALSSSATRAPKSEVIRLNIAAKRLISRQCSTHQACLQREGRSGGLHGTRAAVTYRTPYSSHRHVINTL